MKVLMKLFLFLLVLPLFATAAASDPLEKEIQALSVSENLPPTISTEKLYSTQSRKLPLKRKIEVLVMSSQGLAGNDFLKTNQLGGEIQYHFSDRWALAAAYSKVSNKFSNSSEKLMSTEGLLPDVDYAKSRTEGKVVANLFYGKFRFFRDQAIFFDQYIAVGMAQNELKSGNSTGPMADLGIATWISNWASLHIGIRDYYYRERGVLASGSNHNVDAYIQSGVLF